MIIKICCIKSIDEANLAIRYGASALGLVSDMPDGPGVISEREIVKIRKALPKKISLFLLSSKKSYSAISSQIDLIKPSHLQLVDYIDPKVIRTIKSNYPDIAIVQVIHISDDSAFDLLSKYEKLSDFFLLDSGSPFSEMKSLGGTGKTHDWNISREFVRKSKKPVFLAGGLNARNINKAAKEVMPYGFDLCSSVRTNDCLDENKLKEFFEATY